MSMDNRAVVHIAGSALPYTEQRCLRCHTRLNNGVYADSRWGEGATVANHGHGGWSRLDGPVDPAKYRWCWENNHA